MFCRNSGDAVGVGYDAVVGVPNGASVPARGVQRGATDETWGAKCVKCARNAKANEKRATNVRSAQMNCVEAYSTYFLSRGGLFLIITGKMACA